MKKITNPTEEELTQLETTYPYSVTYKSSPPYPAEVFKEIVFLGEFAMHVSSTNSTWHFKDARDANVLALLYPEN